jgi:hypothetical protein
MARKQITAVRLVDGAPATGWTTGHVALVTWIEDGKSFPHEEPREQIARAVNSGEPFYVRSPDGQDVAVKAQLRHGKYFLVTTTDPAGAEHLLTLPTHPR